MKRPLVLSHYVHLHLQMTKPVKRLETRNPRRAFLSQIFSHRAVRSIISCSISRLETNRLQILLVLVSLETSQPLNFTNHIKIHRPNNKNTSRPPIESRAATIKITRRWFDEILRHMCGSVLDIGTSSRLSGLRQTRGRVSILVQVNSFSYNWVKRIVGQSLVEARYDQAYNISSKRDEKRKTFLPLKY